MQSKEGSADQIAPRLGTLEVGELGGSWGPPGADGGPVMQMVAPPPDARPFTAQYSPCLRACRYYFRAQSHFDHGNPDGTFEPGREPRQSHHICMRIPGVHLELSGDSPVYQCTAWHPADPVELVKLEKSRAQYFERNPDHHLPELAEVDGELDNVDDEVTRERGMPGEAQGDDKETP